MRTGRTVFAAIALVTTVAASGASAQGINLSGPWQCVAQCLAPPGSFAYITQYGWDINLVNEAGMASRAWIDYPGHIWVQRANQGAIYSPDGFTLQFDSGTIWQRPQCRPLRFIEVAANGSVGQVSPPAAWLAYAPSASIL